MPVEATRIKGRFKELFKADLSNKRLDELSARLAKKLADDAEDSDIDQLLNDANDLYPFTEMVKDEHKLVAAENKLKNQKPTNQQPNDPPQDPKPSDQQPPKDEVPAWAQSLLNEVKELKEGKVIETKTQAAKSVFEKSEVFKNLSEKGKNLYFKQIELDSETPFEEQVKSLEETHLEIVQAKADNADYSGKPPAGGADNKPSDKELDEIVSIAGK